MNKVVMFSGQGSQVEGMGGNLFQEYPSIVGICDELLDYSIVDLCLGKIGDLNNTLYTQVAIYVVNHLMFLNWLDNNKNEKIEYLIGHSLGEYNALCASGSFSFKEGLKLVIKRAELMNGEKDGSMAAVLKTSKEELEKKISTLNNKIDLANINTKEQIVISGKKEDISQFVNELKNEKIKAIPLKVSGAFHSRYMLNARNQFYDFIEPFRFLDLKIKVISNKTALPYNNMDIAQTLADQINHSVQWVKTIEYIRSQGDFDFIEISSKSVLMNFLVKI